MSHGSAGAWTRRARGRAFITVVIAALSAAPSAAQSTAAADRADLITYVVDADSTTAFEQIISALASRLKAPTADRALRPTAVRVFRVAEPLAIGRTTYLLLFEPPLVSSKQALESLIAEAWPPDEAAAVIEQLRKATRDQDPSQASLDLLQSISPLEALRGKLETELATQLNFDSGGARAAREDLARLDQLKGVLWAIDDVQYHVIDRTTTASRVQWSVQVRNPSLLQPLFASVAIEFRDKDGVAVAAAPPVVIQLEPLMSRPLSGEIDVSVAAGQRIVSASAMVRVRR